MFFVFSLRTMLRYFNYDRMEAQYGWILRLSNHLNEELFVVIWDSCSTEQLKDSGIVYVAQEYFTIAGNWSEDHFCRQSDAINGLPINPARLFNEMPIGRLSNVYFSTSNNYPLNLILIRLQA